MTHTSVHAEDIHVGQRQRQVFKDRDLVDLADSILRVGLIHAPVLTPDYTVVAGERRSTTANRETFKFFYQKFFHILEAKSSSLYQISIAVRGLYLI